MRSALRTRALDGSQMPGGVTEVADGNEPEPSLVISPAALGSIRTVGPTAWVVLEMAALDALDDEGVLVAHVSSRSIAAAVSMSKDTVASALRRLADAGLIERQPQHRTSGRFGAAGYVIHLPAGLTTTAATTSPTTGVHKPSTAPPVPADLSRPRPHRSRPSEPPRPEPPHCQRHDQLTLLEDPQDPPP